MKAVCIHHRPVGVDGLVDEDAPDPAPAVGDAVDLDGQPWEDAIGQVDLVVDRWRGARPVAGDRQVRRRTRLGHRAAEHRPRRHACPVFHPGAQARPLVEVTPRRRWVRPQIGAVYPLAETREAFAAEAHGGIPGKVTRQVLD